VIASKDRLVFVEDRLTTRVFDGLHPAAPVLRTDDVCPREDLTLDGGADVVAVHRGLAVTSLRHGVQRVGPRRDHLRSERLGRPVDRNLL
jgi:hypothetical protein